MDLPSINKPQRDNISLDLLKDKPRSTPEYKAPEITLSKTIQEFDSKKTKSVEYKAPLLNEEPNSPTASQMLTDPIYNRAGRALGVDNMHSWYKNHEKIKILVEWAKKETRFEDSDRLSSWLYSQTKQAPSMGGTKIDDLYSYFRLKTPKQPAKTKIITKKVYVKQKMTQDEMVNRLIQGM